MSQHNLLGAYLRARRALISPASVGLPHHGARRVPGLRREEVAMLAGISSDYYLRLEQGVPKAPVHLHRRKIRPGVHTMGPSPSSRG